MADIATISLRADTSSLEQGDKALDHFGQTAEKATKQADGLNESNIKLASSHDEAAKSLANNYKATSDYNASVERSAKSSKAASVIIEEQKSGLNALLDRINPTNKAFAELDEVSKKLRAAKDSNLIDTEQFEHYNAILFTTADKLNKVTEALTEEGRAAAAQATADQKAAEAKENFLRKIKEQVITQNMSKQELLQYKATQLGVSSSADVYIKKINESSDAVHSFSLKSAGARRELGVMLGELARGNFGALRGSSITLANRSGLIDQLFSLKGAAIAGGIGLATAALVGLYKVYETAEKESSAFNKSIILTGEYSGLTAKQLANMAAAVGKNTGTVGAASEVLSKLAGAGVSSAVNFKEATASIVEFSHYSGQSIDDLVKQFAQLSDDPSGGSIALTKNLHYLTAAQYQHISALQEEGDKAGAVTAATDALSGAMERRAKEIKDSMGTLPSFFDEIGKSASKMWDGIWGLGRDPSKAEERAKLVAKIGFAENDPRRANGGSPTVSNETLSQWKSELAALDAVEKKQTNISQINQEAIKAQQEVNKLIQQGLTPAEKRAKSEKELNRWIEANKKAHTEDAAVVLFTEAQIAKARAGIEKQNKDPKTPKTKAYHDDAATKALLDSDARIAALREQSKVTETMTEQEKQLAKFTQQIADLKSKIILTADQKSLLARSGEITASLQLEAQLSRENVERKKATEALKKMEEYTTSIVAKNKQNQDRFGLTSKQAGRVDQEAQLDNTFRKDTKGIKGINDAEQLAKITAEYNKAKAELHAGFRQEDLNEGDWLAGMTQGLEQYGETANNVFSATAQLAQTTMGSMTSMATQMMTTGSANVKQFATNVLTSIVDIINRLLIAQAIQAAMGWMSGGASAGTGAAANSSFSGGAYNNLTFAYDGGYIPQYDRGGYTGDGGKFEPKGVVHGGEFVFTKEATNRIGIDNLYQMMRGYTDGGLVSNAVTATAPMLGMQGGGNNITVGIGDVVIMSDSQKENNASNSQDIGVGIQKQLKPAIVATISEQLRIPGTPLWMAMNGNR